MEKKKEVKYLNEDITPGEESAKKLIERITGELDGSEDTPEKEERQKQLHKQYLELYDKQYNIILNEHNKVNNKKRLIFWKVFITITILILVITRIIDIILYNL